MKFKDLVRQRSGIELTLENSLITPLLSWTEYVGSIVEVMDNFLVLELTQRVLIPVSYKQLKESGALPRSGDEIAILILEGGRIRIRNIIKNHKVEGGEY